MTPLTREDKDAIRRSVARLLAKAGDADRFSTGLRKLLRSLGRPEDAAGAARAIPGLGESFGVPVPVLGLIAAELSPWGKEHPEGAFSLVARLWEGKARDERVLAAKLLERLGKLHPERTLEVASPLVGDLRNWEECDQLASFGLRNVVTARPDLVLPRCADWGRSEARWTRRFAVVVLTSLPKKKGYVPSEGEFAILDRAMLDPAHEVQDAVAWAVREIAKRHPEAAAVYLNRHAESANRYTQRIVRLAAKGLPEAARAGLDARLGGRGRC